MFLKRLLRPIIGGPFVLSSSEGRENLTTALSGHPDFRSWSPEALVRSLSAWATHGPTAWTPQIDENGALKIIASATVRYVVALETVLRLGLWLSRLEQCRGFSKTVAHLNNPSQFLSTLHEFECADLCYRQKYFYGLEFEPAVATRRNGKLPDFKISEAGFGDIVCECKDMQNASRAVEALAPSFRRDLMQALEQRRLANEYRAEVEIRSLPNEARPLLIKRITDAISNAQALATPAIVHGTQERIRVAVSLRSSPLVFSGGMSTAGFGLEEPATNTNTEDIPLCITVKSKTTTDTGRLLALANGQLPRNGWGVIFLRPVFVQDAMEAVWRRITDPAYKRLLAVIARHETGWQVATTSSFGVEFAKLLLPGNVVVQRH